MIATLLAMTMLAVAPPTPAADADLDPDGSPAAGGQSADVETAWLSRGDQLVVLETRLDPIRGFDEVLVDVRTLDAATGVQSSERREPLLPRQQLGWLARHGQIELYRVDRQRAQHALGERLLREGWQELVPLPRAAAGVAGHDASKQHVTLAGVTVAAQLTAAAESCRISVARPDTGTACPVVTIPIDVRDLGDERIVRLEIRQIRSVALSGDARWAVLTVDSVVPIHAAVAPQRRVFAVPTQALIDALALPGSDEST